MTLRVSGKNLDIGEALRERVEGRLQQALDRHFDGGFSGHVTVEREGGGFKADCALHLDTGVVLKARGNGGDAYASFDEAAIKLEKRLRRYHRRLKDRHVSGPARGVPDAGLIDYTLAAPDDEDGVSPDADGAHPPIVAETQGALATLSVGEAVMNMDLADAPVLVFLHAANSRINVVYRRADGTIGWIDPTPDSARD